MYRALLLVCLLVVGVFADEGEKSSPKIIVVGAGSSGIAAATRLLEHGFNDLTVLEAENRIGGRVYTTDLDGYAVDLGGQWVHGEPHNVAYDLAFPLGLLDHSKPEFFHWIMYKSNGELMDEQITNDTRQFFSEAEVALGNENANLEGSVADFYEARFNQYCEKHPEITDSMKQEFLWLFNLLQTGSDAADNWHDIAAKGYEMVDGDRAMNWKERGYSTILDILMKKIPDPEKELPLKDKIILNAEVTKVDYSGDDGHVKVTTSDGKEYTADHVIMTPSLGVLKATHETLFNPQLPESKVNSIKGLGFGVAAKILLAFEEPWWGDKVNESGGFCLMWDMKEKAEYESDPMRKWMPSAVFISFVEHKPRALLIWISGEGARHADQVPDELYFNQTMHLLNKFFSKDYNITAPTAMKRSQWSTNDHFRGTYSFFGLESEKMNASYQVLAEPIVHNGKPVVLFAGEATNEQDSATVHGAIASGWREADRIIKHYDTSNKDDDEKKES